jgi:hypothetical protein
MYEGAIERTEMPQRDDAVCQVAFFVPRCARVGFHLCLRKSTKHFSLTIDLAREKTLLEEGKVAVGMQDCQLAADV